MNERVPLAYLVPLRVLFGVILVLEGWGKLQGGWLHGDALLSTLDKWMGAGKTYAFFVPVIESARAHPKIFGALVTLGELVIGLSLLAGVLTRLSSALGALMLFSFALGSGQGLVPPGNALIMGAVCVVFVLAPPGRALGIDARLRGHVPRWMV
jgi:thiosulfate dehydrogenase [quinone] large subunit